MPRLTDGLELGVLLRDPEDRDRQLDVVVLALLRGDESVAAPADDTVLQPEDELLLAARPAARRSLDATLTHPPTTAYVLDGRFVPSGWLWRRLTGRGLEKDRV
jgi:hypothetical protein